MNKSIDVIIPIYNQEKYLKRCLDSIVCQNMENVTLILVNDGSKDNSLEICKDYEKKYDNIKVFDKPNGGAGSARNLGLDNSNSELITFIDPDDYIENDYLDWIDKQPTGDNLVVFSYKIKHVDFGDMDVITESGIFSSRQAICMLEKAGLFNSPVNKVYSRKIIEENNIRFIEHSEPGEDLIFNCDYFKCIERVLSSDKIIYNYMRNGEDSMSNTFRENLWEKNKTFIKAIEDMYDYYNMDGEEEQKCLALSCVTYVHTNVPNMYRKGKTVEKAKRLAFYDEVLQSDKFKIYFDNLDTDSKFLQQLKKAYKTGSAKKMDRHYRFLMSIRNNFSGLYNFLRKRFVKN